MNRGRSGAISGRRIDDAVQAASLQVPTGRCRRDCEEVSERDPDGRIVLHHRTVDTLGRMLASGAIDQAMHDAAKDLQAAFVVASLDPLRALSLLRVPGNGPEPHVNEQQLDARRRIHDAMTALGGISSPAGSCVWHVVGLQRSVREWAMRQGWGGRPVRQEQAQGILVAALGMLAGRYDSGQVGNQACLEGSLRTGSDLIEQRRQSQHSRNVGETSSG